MLHFLVHCISKINIHSLFIKIIVFDAKYGYGLFCHASFFSTLFVCENTEIRPVVIGDMQRKNNCVQMKLGKVVDGMVDLQRTQLNFVYCRLGLEEPMVDTMPNVEVTSTTYSNLYSTWIGRFHIRQ